MKISRTIRSLVHACFLFSASLTVSAATAASPAEAIFATTQVQGGLVVHLGSGDGGLTAALRRSPAYRVHGLDRNADLVARARANLREAGLNGPVSVDQLSGDRLPYIDNLVNLVVARDLAGIGIERAEVLRVLAPNGEAVLWENGRWNRIVKPRPAELDEWTHYFYDSRGNAVSHDTVVAPPERLQWVGTPKWSRHHDRMASTSAMVTAGGRMFYIMDEGSRVSILLPSHWNLVARDAFNGVELWRLPILQWHNQLWPLKSGPTQLARRLVAEGDRVYVTLSIDAPISQLDAATGKTLQQYAETKGAEEILHRDGKLIALVNPRDWQLEDYAPKFNTGDQKRVETEFNWDRKPRKLVGLDAATGKVLWRHEGLIAPLTLATDGKHVVFSDGQKLVAKAFDSGKELWSTEPVQLRRLFEYNFSPRVVLHGNRVLYAGGDGAMKGFDIETGREVWKAPHEKSGYRSPEDLMVAGGLVWNAPTLSGKMTGEFTGRDPVTGEVKKQFPPDVETYWFHHRCYIAKATDRFLMPSRTGIEFVDFEKEHWDINHWVRGGCLYGVLPANGLTYAPPHNCACYPEAKLYGLNALSAGTTSPHPPALPEAQRLLKGPAYGAALEGPAAGEKDWPTFRHDNQRSGFTPQDLVADLGQSWEMELGGKLSSPTIAAGHVYVTKPADHTVYALNARTGKPAWVFTAGGPVDSPPTYWKGRVLFGSADGRVYCLRASDGELVWRYQAAPSDRRLMAFEELESVWPVHGSVMVQEDKAMFVAGRSVFLDGGMWYIHLDAATGRKVLEEHLDDIDPETGQDLQVRLQTLQMPVGLNDILSSDGKWVYLRSQKLNAQGKRVDIGPVSGNAAVQGGTQRGEGAHLFAPMGFLDDTWFHRSYWVYGKNFAGGHNGYYQAGKYAPAGRILVFDEKNVYGYGREPKYLKWTTTLEHQLFASSKVAPDVEPVGAQTGNRKKGAAPAVAGPIVQFPNATRFDPTGKPLTVEAWVLPDGDGGVIVAHGGPQNGYALVLAKGRPAWMIRSDNQLVTAQAKEALAGGWHHLVGVLGADLGVQLYVDGKAVAEAKATGLVASQPKQTLEFGGDSGSSVGEYAPGSSYTGMLDQVALYHRALSPEDIRRHFLRPDSVGKGTEEKLVLYCSFDHGDARDQSGGKDHGVGSKVDSGKGRLENGLWFRQPKGTALAGKKKGAKGKAAAARPPANDGSFVQRQWSRYVPVITRAMAKAGDTLLIAGAPDVLDEEYVFERLTQKDNQAVQAQIEEQEASLDGREGGSLWAVSTSDGHRSSGIELKSPPVWDGMAIAQGRLFVVGMDGKVRCFGK